MPPRCINPVGEGAYLTLTVDIINIQLSPLDLVFPKQCILLSITVNKFKWGSKLVVLNSNGCLIAYIINMLPIEKNKDTIEQIARVVRRSGNIHEVKDKLYNFIYQVMELNSRFSQKING